MDESRSTPDVDAGEASGGVPSLDTQETSLPSTSHQTYRDFLTSGMAKDIDFTERVYTAIDERGETRRQGVYNSCRSSAWFVRHNVTGIVRMASSRCNLRWCPLCIKTKRFIMVQSLVPFIQKATKPKFLTLTLKHTEAPLSHQIDSLYKFFSQLRRRPWFKARVGGGVWFFQVKQSENDGLWHPHLHCLLTGKYLPHAELKEIWSYITKGSSIVDIRAVKDAKKAAEYVARYASAPCRLSDLSLEKAVECVDALHGRRICGTWGSAKEVQLVPKKCPDSENWSYLAGFTEVMFLRSKSDWHREIYRAFVQDDFCYSTHMEQYPPPDEVILPDNEEPTSFKQFVFEWSGFYK